MTAADLQRKLHDKPFTSFRVKLLTNETIDVHNPNMVIVGDSSAVLPTAVRKGDYGWETAVNWRTIAIDHIVSFEDITAPGSRRKRAGA